MRLRIVTWNLHGSARPDLEWVAKQLEGFGADVVALQEVQRRQVHALAQQLRAVTAHWSLKHLPLGNPAEGLAVLSPHRLVDARTVTLSTGAPFWSYRRRIAQLCALDLGGHVFRLANCHLASDDAGARRAQAAQLLAVLEPGTVVVGDLNARPGRAVLRRMSRAGLRDAWGELHPGAPDGDGATNWRDRDRDELPSNRLDYILVPEGCRVVDATVPSAADSDLSRYRRLSDHLPVRAELESVGGDPVS